MLKNLLFSAVVICLFSNVLLRSEAFDELQKAILIKDTAKAVNIIKTRSCEIADMNAIHPYEQDSRTSLHHAALLGQRDVVEALLNAGAQHNIRDSAGEYPAELALSFRHLATLEVILSHLKRAKPNELYNLLNVPNPNSQITLLHSAILDGNLDAVRMLVGQFGAQVTEEDIAQADNPINGRQTNLELASYLRQQRELQQRSSLGRLASWLMSGWGGSGVRA